MRQSKLDQIIWRDLYHLQSHSKSVLEWNGIKPLEIKSEKINNPFDDIMKELKSVIYNNRITDLTGNIIFKFFNLYSIESDSSREIK